MNKNKVSEILLKAQQVREKIGATTDAAERENLQREYNGLMDQANEAIAAINAENAEKQREQLGKQNQPAKTKSEQFREFLQEVKRSGASCEREVPAFGGITYGIQVTESGAINLTIKDLIPNLEEGTGLPAGINIATGVEGNTLYPSQVDDVELEEVGENVEGTDQVFHFDKLTVTPHRVTLSVDISNKAIDNKALDILAVAQQKFAKAQRKYLARKVYSPINWGADANNGGFSGLTASKTVVMQAGCAKEIMTIIAEFRNKGLNDGQVCLVIDALTEAKLKLCPIDAEGKNPGYVIANGKLLGYDYVVTHYINTKIDAQTKKMVADTQAHMGIGFFNTLAIQQHGAVRLTCDATSKAMAKKNAMNLTLNTEYSFTNLGKILYDENGQHVATFKLINLNDPVAKQ